MLKPTTSTTYGTVSRLAHTLGALGILAMLAIGIYFHDMPRGNTKNYWLGIHVGLGTLLFVPLMFRVGWGALSKRPDKIEMSAVEKFLATAVQRLLLVAVAAMLLTGILLPWSGGHALEAFGLFSLGSPMGESESLHEGLETVHQVGGKAVLVLTAVHIIGVIKQSVKDFDSLKGRMFL